MTRIVLLGEHLDAILVPEPFRHETSRQQRYVRYYSARLHLAMRGVLCPNHELRERLGRQYQAAWRAGRVPDLRFVDLRHTPLEPVWDPARGERRAGRDASHHPPGRGHGAVAVMSALIAGIAAIARCRA